MRPAPTQFDSQDFDGRFAFRLATTASDAGDRRLRSARPARSSRCASRPTLPRPSPPAQGRQIRVDLGRLDALMKQVGELVVAKNRLGALAAEAADPDLAEVSERIARLVVGDAGGGDRRAHDAGG